MKTFFYQGKIGCSKSLMNRALILQSYFPDLQIEGSSLCQDVQELRAALDQKGDQHRVKVSAGGTTFRFLCLKLSRQTGDFFVEAEPRLLQRPQTEILHFLDQVGVRVEAQKTGFRISGRGWQLPEAPVQMDGSKSSQFLSALVLNSPRLSKPLRIEIKGELVSSDYFEMTLKLCKKLGSSFKRDGSGWTFFPWTALAEKKVSIGADLSSVFSVAALAAMQGELRVTNIIDPEWQPDHIFFQILKEMGAEVLTEGSELKVSRASVLRGVEWNLSRSPDLFPVLAALCAVAQGPSRLYGAPHLKYKESDRLQKVFELLSKASVDFEPLSDGVKLKGGSLPKMDLFEFDPDHDHRMAMAAALFKARGWNIRILHPETVEKSFPEFWKISGVVP